MMWKPTASLEALQKRAQILKKIRQFFEDRGILEVETPLMGKTATPDPLIEPFVTSYKGPIAPHGQTLYLQTSPEFAMKRLLAAGYGAMFQICKAFRNGEVGRLHNAEFTMLEWYRPGLNHEDLIQEVSDLLVEILDVPEAELMSYQGIFEHYLSFNPHELSICTPRYLEAIAQAQGLIQELDELDLDYNGWLDLLFSEIIQPQLGMERPLVIVDFPASMAALAQIRHESHGTPVAERFEFYVRGVELANGYHELLDAKEQTQRFEENIRQRASLGGTPLAMDDKLLAALEAGLPACSGVALGIDRLVMVALNAKRLNEVMSFDLGSI